MRATSRRDGYIAAALIAAVATTGLAIMGPHAFGVMLVTPLRVIAGWL